MLKMLRILFMEFTNYNLQFNNKYTLRFYFHYCFCCGENCRLRNRFDDAEHQMNYRSTSRHAVFCKLMHKVPRNITGIKIQTGTHVDNREFFEDLLLCQSKIKLCIHVETHLEGSTHFRSIFRKSIVKQFHNRLTDSN